MPLRLHTSVLTFAYPSEYDDTAERLLKGQQAMTKVIAEITCVALEGATLESRWDLGGLSLTLMPYQRSSLS
jgi:hypothetical protein